MKKSLLICLSFILAGCVSTKNTIKNIDNNATLPIICSDYFILKPTTENKYGYHQDYPVNLGYSQYEESNKRNIDRFFRALTGPNGEKITYKSIETCCPFPSKNSKIGAGTLDIYEVKVEGQTETKKIYINIYEKGFNFAPKGFNAKTCK
jgi:hypothetical protein